MTSSLAVQIRDVEIRIGEAWTRLPFRYGNACLTAVPLAHVRVTVESGAGAVAAGISADCLPPRWFDKDPSRNFRRNVEDQLTAIRTAREVWLEIAGPRSRAAPVYGLWERAHPGVLERVQGQDINRLTASFGNSLLERAAIDAVCRLGGVSFHEALRRGVLGYPAGPEIPDRPLEEIHVRHTVGLGDAILAGDIPAAERLSDGLPEALEEDIEAHGLRYFKVKVSGNSEQDLDRLERIAHLLASRSSDGYHVSLDGNEQYRELGELEALLADLGRSEDGRRFLDSILFIEQPLAREVALDRDVKGQVERLGRIRPVIIDESDDDLDSLDRAIELGYRGCSIKNCKGVFKALRFRARIAELNRRAGRRRYFQTGEDLANLAVIPLQQDLTTLASLEVRHAERNGHHYFRGLGHLPAAESASALEAHPDLYEERDGMIRLRIVDGRIRCGSLQAAGYGYSARIALEERLPAEAWRFERLRLDME